MMVAAFAVLPYWESHLEGVIIGSII